VAPPPPPEFATPATGQSLSLEDLLSDTAGATRAGNVAGSATGANTAAAQRKTTAEGSPHSNRKIRNLSLAAIVAGAIGLATFAVPYVGPAIGLLGALVGFYGVCLASARRNSPLLLGLFGAALCVVAAGLGGYTTYRGFQSAAVATNAQKTSPAINADAIAAQPTSDAIGPGDFNQFAGAAIKSGAAGVVADARDPLNFAAAAVAHAVADPSKTVNRLASAAAVPAAQAAPGAAGATSPTTLRLQDPSGPSGKEGEADAELAKAAPANAVPANEPSAVGKLSSAPAAAAKTVTRWAAADQAETQGSDEVQVTVLKAVTGPLFFHLGGDSLLDGHYTEQPFLQISLKIQNNQAAGGVDYKGWMSLPESAVTLTDNKGTAVARFDVKRLATPKRVATLDNVHLPTTLDTSQSLEDVIIFALPPQSAEYLRLKLSGKAVGLPDDLYFQIPKSMIKPAETVNPILPLGSP
jgi:hypothetical protein